MSDAGVVRGRYSRVVSYNPLVQSVLKPILLFLLASAMAQEPAMHVTGGEPNCVPSLPTRVRVNPTVMNSRCVLKTIPILPKEAQGRHILPTVALHVVVGKDGRVKEAEVLNGDSALVKLALKEVRRWRYHTYIYQGFPVEVDTTAVVSFRAR